MSFHSRLSVFAAAAAVLIASLAVGPAASADANGSARDSARLRPYERFVYVTAKPKSADEVDRIWAEAEHVLEPHDPKLVSHTLVITPETLGRLRAAGIDAQRESVNVQQMVDESYRRNEQPTPFLVGAFDAWFNKVQELPAIESYLADLVGMSAGRAKIVDIGKSIEGRSIHALLISSNPGGAERASIITTGTHHPREWLSPMVTMGIADALVRQYDSDARVKRVVDNLDVYVIPVMNPDGYVQTFDGNRLQRRNMHPGCNVDLNRNYSTAFGQKVSNSCSSDTNCGTMPFSEPETQALRQLAESLKKLRFYVDYHSNANQVMIPYAYTQTAPPDYAKNKLWGETLGAQAMVPAGAGYQVAQGEGGGALDWFREVYTDSLVVELPGQGFDPPSNGVNANVELQWNGWIAVADLVAAENPATGGGAGGAGPVAGAGGGRADGSAGASGGSGAAGAGGTAGAAASGGSSGSAGANGLEAGAAGTAPGLGGVTGGGASGNGTLGSGASGSQPVTARANASAGCACQMRSASGRSIASAWLFALVLAISARRRHRTSTARKL